MKIFSTISISIICLAISSMLIAQTAIPGDIYDVEKPGLIVTSGAGAGSNEKEQQSVQGSLKNYLNMQTGALVYNVPITTISGYHISVPVSLSYYSNGIRVDQESQPVGLGWSLAAGGAVTRVLKGLPDESENGYLNTGSQTLSFDGKTEEEKKAYAQEIIDGDLDSQPDIFQFSAPGLQGYFAFDSNGEIIIYPLQKNIQIEYYVNGSSGRISSFKIKKDDGTTYSFGDGAEYTVENIKQSSLSVPLITKENHTDFYDLRVYQKDNNTTVGPCQYANGECASWNGDPCYIESVNGDKYLVNVPPNIHNEIIEANISLKIYSSVKSREIDYENIKEEVGESYSSKWFLTKIEHISGDNLTFKYVKLDEQISVSRPVLTSVTFEDISYSASDCSSKAFYELENPENELEFSVVLPRAFRAYETANPDFYPDYENAFVIPWDPSSPPIVWERPTPIPSTNFLYFAPSLHYSLNQTSIRRVLLKEIISSSGQKVEFLNNIGADEYALKNIRVYKKNEKLLEFTLDNELITSDLSVSEYSDPFNYIEYLASQNIEFQNDDAKYVSRLSNYNLNLPNHKLSEYLSLQYSDNQYKRLILRNVLVSTGEESKKIASFTYKNPEHLPRKNAVNNTLFYPIGTSDLAGLVSSSYKNNFDQVVYTASLWGIGNYDSDLGILKEVQNESGGILRFGFGKNAGSRLINVEQYDPLTGKSFNLGINYNTGYIDEDQNKYLFNSSHSIQANGVIKSSIEHAFYGKNVDHEDLLMRSIIRSSEIITDWNWFNSEKYSFAQCNIDYNGNGYEVFKFLTSASIADINYTNRVYFLPETNFYDDYNFETHEWGIHEVRGSVDNYSQFPYSNIKSTNFAIGQIKEQYILNKDQKILKKSIHSYDFLTDPSQIKTTKGIIARTYTGGNHLEKKCPPKGWVWFACVASKVDTFVPDDHYRIGSYDLFSYAFHLSKIENYDLETAQGSEVATTSENFINETTLMNRRTVNDLPNDEGTVQTITLFADDFANTSGFIGALKDNNLKTLPIEQVTYKVDALGNTYILGAQHYIYDESNPLQILEQYQLELDEPLPLSEFRFANALSMGEIPDDNFIGIYAKYQEYVKTNIENKYDGLNRIYATRGEDELWSGTIHDMYRNSPAAEISNQELMITEESLNLENTENLSGSDIEHDLNITLTINKAQTVTIDLESNATENDNFDFKLLTNGVIRQSSIWTSNKTYNLTLEPGVYDVEFYTQKNEPDQNGYYKTMRIAYVSDQLNALFSSFEEEGIESIDARTGDSYYHGIFNVPVSINVQSEYVMSYWHFSGGEWQFSGEIPFQATVNVGAPIDDLKVYKKGALMKGYVYDKKGLLIAEIDANENRVLNEYDELNRLKIVRNTDKDIVKKYEYQIIHQQ